MKLTNRLLTVAKHVDNDAVVADIGTDHGYIPVYLVEKGISEKIFATDINEGPLKSAEKQIESHKMSEKISTRKCDGLSCLGGERIDNIIIAGMGGILIKEILEKDKIIALNAKKLILQPMVAQEEVRKYLLENGFLIINEDLAKEKDRLYQIIVASPGEKNQGETKQIYFHIGKHLIENNHPLLPEFIGKMERKFKKIIHECENKHTNTTETRIKECKKMLEEIQEVKECL
ncbi:MAG: SAM-dependent methyltransferase [Eubacteriaceae bacterium]|nr:SAM-dependent methyltransferase [Eubacteriaceae bacterium]